MWAIFLLLLLQTTPPVGTQAEADRLFALGVDIYADGDLAGAIAAFRGAEATGWRSGMLQYNLGSAYLSLERFGPAILHLERARRLMPGNEAATHNLRIARERAGIASESASPFGVLSSRVAGMGGPQVWLIFGLLLYNVVIGLIGFRFWRRRTDAWSRRAITVLVPVTVAVLAIGFSAWGGARTQDGIIMSENAQLRTLPSSEAASRGSLEPGQLVHLTEARGDWQSVQLPGGARGWLPSRAVERI